MAQRALRSRRSATWFVPFGLAVALAAPSSGARSGRNVPVTARFVSFTYYRAHTCNLEFGILYANVRNARSYSLGFNQKRYGAQKLENQAPNRAFDQILAFSTISHARTSHFWEIGSGGAVEPKSECTSSVSPYASQYSKLRVTAELK
jgi:hypothetical protein